RSVPLLTVMEPACVLVPLRIQVPAPSLTMLPAPERLPAKVLIPPKLPPSVKLSTTPPATKEALPLRLSAPMPSLRIEFAPLTDQLRLLLQLVPVYRRLPLLNVMVFPLPSEHAMPVSASNEACTVPVMLVLPVKLFAPPRAMVRPAPAVKV